MADPTYLMVAAIGLLHGLEPGHGWPVALLYASKHSGRMFRAFISSSIISFFHLISSLAVVAAYIILKTFVSFTIPYVNYIAGAVLLILGVRFLLEKSHEEQHGHFHEDFAGGWHTHEHVHSDGTRHSHLHYHPKRVELSLSGIAAFAFILGFAHEEEFALLALAVGGIDPLGLMLIYALAVAGGLIGITLAAITVYGKVERSLKRHGHLLPKLSGAVLIIAALSFFLGLR
ncbi:MAG: nickel/cobalt transporter [Nitrososphaerota archaeon]